MIYYCVYMLMCKESLESFASVEMLCDTDEFKMSIDFIKNENMLDIINGCPEDFNLTLLRHYEDEDEAYEYLENLTKEYEIDNKAKRRIEKTMAISLKISK